MSDLSYMQRRPNSRLNLPNKDAVHEVVLSIFSHVKGISHCFTTWHVIICGLKDEFMMVRRKTVIDWRRRSCGETYLTSSVSKEMFSFSGNYSFEALKLITKMHIRTI